MADGWITIGTELSTDKFDRQISALEKKMKKEEEKGIVIGAKLSSQEQELEIARKKTDELAEAYQKLKEAQDKLATGKATPMDFTTAQNLQNTFGSLDKISINFDKALTKQDQLEAKVEGTKLQYNAINDKVNEYKQKIETIRIDKHASDVQKLQKGFSGVGTSVERVTKRISRLILSIFGIRSALMIIRRASSDLANYDQDYANKLEYIRFVLAQAIAPVLRGIVNLAMTLMSYINAIAQAWFGVNLFANGSAESFKRMKNQAQGVNQAVGGVSKAVKQIKKQLAGFDEINVLSADAEGGTGAGAGGVGTGISDLGIPDLSKIQGKVPEWLKWIANHKDEVIAGLIGIAAAIAAMKIAELLKALGLIGGSLSAIKALGIGLMISSIIYGVKSLIEYLKNPTWENFGKLIQSIGGFVLGLGLAIGNIPLIIAGVAIIIYGLIVKHWEEVKKAIAKGMDWLTDKSDWVHDHFGDIIGNMYDFIVANIQQVVNIFSAQIEAIKQIFDGWITFFKGVFSGDWKMIWEGLKNVFLGIINEAINTAIGLFNMLVNAVTTVIKQVKAVFEGGINVITSWFEKMGIKVPEVIGERFKSIINAVLAGVENFLNTPINAINSFIDQVNSIPGVSISHMGNVSLGRLAVGGIVNMPNKGTMVGGRAIAGESGAEGVIPLTDTQAMETLGEAIGRYITINATIENRMNGRVISRELKEVRSNQDFAFNT